MDRAIGLGFIVSDLSIFACVLLAGTSKLLFHSWLTCRPKLIRRVLNRLLVWSLPTEVCSHMILAIVTKKKDEASAS